MKQPIRTNGTSGCGAGRRPIHLPCSWKEKGIRTKIQIIQRLKTASALMLFLVMLALPVRAANDIWTNTVSGKWENSTNWSLGVAPSASYSIYITNGGFNGKTVTIDATTSLSYSNTMAVTSLSVCGPSAGFTNILALTGAGTNAPLHVATTLALGDGVAWGWLSLSNSALDVGTNVNLSLGLMTLIDSSLTVTNGGFQVESNGSVTLSGATLKLKNGTLGLGNNGATNNGGGAGSVVVSNSTLNATVLTLGSMAGGVGMLTVQSNASVNISSNITLVSSSLSVTSSITLNGGTFTAANGVTQVGSAGNGLLTIAGGSNTFRQILLNPQGMGSAGLHLHGGHLRVLGNGSGPGQGIASNWIIWDEAGDIEAGDTSLTIGMDTPGSYLEIVPGTGGNAQFATMYVGYGPNGVNGSGSFTNQGAPFCEVDVTNQMTVGGDGAVGNVTLDGGMLCVTNPIHSALLIISNGTVVLNPPGTDVNTGAGWPGGVLYVDNLTMSNACGHLINYGQTLIISQTNLDPNLDADGTGMSNANKLLAGLDLFNPSSVFAITNVSLITNNNNQYIQVDWTTQGGHYYRLQASASLSGPFTNVGPQMFALGNGAGGLSYMDSTWAATNGPRFYRVLLGAAH